MRTIKACSVCADILVGAGGEPIEGELREGTPCEFHRGPTVAAVEIVRIDESRVPEPPEEAPMDPTEAGPVTQIAARFLCAWSNSTSEPHDVMIQRAVSTARRLMRETRGD